MTPCSRRGCGQCGQVNPKEYLKLDLSKAWGKALLRRPHRAFPQAGTVHNPCWIRCNLYLTCYTRSPANVVPTNQLRKGGINLFIRWKMKGWYDYAYLEKRVRDKRKVSTKLVVYLGKHPSSKLEAMLYLGQITVNETADINIVEFKKLRFN